MPQIRLGRGVATYASVLPCCELGVGWAIAVSRLINESCDKVGPARLTSQLRWSREMRRPPSFGICSWHCNTCRDKVLHGRAVRATTPALRILNFGILHALK